MVARPACRRGRDTVKTKLAEIERIDEGVEHTDRIMQCLQLLTYRGQASYVGEGEELP